LPEIFHIFPWQDTEINAGKVISRPMVDVRLSLGSEVASQKALIDTGAPVTMFPRGTADLLGLEMPDEGQTGDDRIILMKREWQCVLHTVTLVLPPFHDVEWEAPVRFAVDEGLPFGLLGFEGFLNRWAVSFDGANGYTVVETVESFDQRVPPDLWEEFQKKFDGWDRPGG
jgi:hypothetical protein